MKNKLCPPINLGGFSLCMKTRADTDIKKATAINTVTSLV